MSDGLKTDYASHDWGYQRKRQVPENVGWGGSAESYAEDWSLSWEPLLENRWFPDSGSLLELGCGAGNLSVAFARRGYGVTGVDIAPTAIAWAQENAAQAGVSATFLEWDVLTLIPIPSESFDIALDGRCLHCIIGGDRAQFFQTAHRILKPGGILALKTMCNEVPPNLWEEFDPSTRCLITNGIATRYIGDSNAIVQEVMAAHFRVVDVSLLPPQHDQDLADLQVIGLKSPPLDAPA